MTIGGGKCYVSVSKMWHNNLHPEKGKKREPRGGEEKVTLALGGGRGPVEKNQV